MLGKQQSRMSKCGLFGKCFFLPIKLPVEYYFLTPGFPIYIQPFSYARYFWCNNWFLHLVYIIHLSLSTDLVDPPPMGTFYMKHPLPKFSPSKWLQFFNDALFKAEGYNYAIGNNKRMQKHPNPYTGIYKNKLCMRMEKLIITFFHYKKRLDCNKFCFHRLREDTHKKRFF